MVALTAAFDPLCDTLGAPTLFLNPLHRQNNGSKPTRAYTAFTVTAYWVRPFGRDGL